MDYLCGRCRSNTCSHVDPRLTQQMLDRYMREQIYRNGLTSSIGFQPEMVARIVEDGYTPAKNKKLLLLRRAP